MIEGISIAKIAVDQLSAALEKFAIDVSPCSAARSTPVLEGEDIESYFDCKSRPIFQSSYDEGQLTLSFVQEAVKSLQALYVARCSQQLILALEDNLLAHLHSNAATISDVEALVPSLGRNFKVVNKLATNIGLFRAKNLISEADLEDMLTHIFTNDDRHYSLFSHTKTKIEKFEKEHEEWKRRRLTYHQRQNQLRRVEELRKSRAEREKRLAARRRESIPMQWREATSSGMLPDGCESIADMITEVDGMFWSQVLEISRVHLEATAFPDVKSKGAVAHEHAIPASDLAPEAGKYFAQTRLHVDLGVHEWRLPTVRLPLPLNDAANLKKLTTSMTWPDFVSDKSKTSYLWARSKTHPDYLFGKEKRKCKTAVVKVRPRQAASTSAVKLKVSVLRLVWVKAGGVSQR